LTNLFGFRPINSISGVKPVLADTTQDSLISCPPPEISGIPYGYDKTLGYCTTYTVDGKCPSPYVFDLTSKNCIAVPVCSGSYIWDIQKKQCVPINLSIIGNETEGGGNFTSSPSEGPIFFCASDLNTALRCVPTVTVSGSQTQLCLLDAVECIPDCSDNGIPITKDGELKCSYPVICPTNYSYNSTVGKCTSEPVCPSGSSRSLDTCLAQPSCLSNETLTTISGQNSTLACLSNADIKCPPDFNFDYKVDKCVSDPLCPSGTVFDPEQNGCVGDPQCPPGGSYNSNSKQCEANKTLNPEACIKQSISIQNSTSDGCINIPYSPHGIISIEVQNGTITIENYCNGALLNRNTYSVTQDFSITYSCLGESTTVSKSGNNISAAGVSISINCSYFYDSFEVRVPFTTGIWFYDCYTDPYPPHYLKCQWIFLVKYELLLKIVDNKLIAECYGYYNNIRFPDKALLATRTYSLSQFYYDRICDFDIYYFSEDHRLEITALFHLCYKWRCGDLFFYRVSCAGSCAIYYREYYQDSYYIFCSPYINYCEYPHKEYFSYTLT
ncbi:MAG: hypothetical protein ACPL1B_10140, partial [Thermoprotei archaeon]